MTINNSCSASKIGKPIFIGVFSVLAVLAVGASVATATGFLSPAHALAEIFDGPPCCTVPPVSPPIVVPPPGTPTLGDIFDGPPCCTLPPVAPPPVTPPTPVPPGDIFDGPPCCTVPPTTPPILPPVVPPVIPPVIPPVVPPTPPVVAAQCEFLTASATTITPGQSVTLSWKTHNATSITINQGIGDVTPVAAGSVVVNPTTSTTYIATVTGATGSVNCQASVTVQTVQTPAQCVFLNGTPNVINAGDPVNLTWKTTNATGISIDNGVGAVTPIGEGSVIVHPTGNTTYIATVTGTDGVSVHCQTSVVVTTIEQGPACVSLTANVSRIRSGDPVTLTWLTTNAASISIDNGVGAVTPVTTGSVVVHPTADTTYTATVPGAIANPGCQARVEIETGGGGCTSGCGGGGGGSPKPKVVLSALKTPVDQSLVYLSQIPYTGLDLGPWGTALYWIMLVLWSLALAYLVLFNAMPLAYRKMGIFGTNVRDVLKQQPAPVLVEAHAPATVAAHAPAHTSHAPAHTDHAHTASHEATVPAGYQAHEGFRSFAEGSVLTIDDIVKGLAREAAINPTASAHELSPSFAASTPEFVPEPVMEMQEELPTPRPMAVAEHAAPFNEDVRSFIDALLKGDRDVVFGTIRGITRSGGDSEAFLTHTVCALDDAYRARMDGSVCHPDILAATADCHPSFLERIVTALTTAVDGSYSTGVTGVKLALTRALAVVNG